MSKLTLESLLKESLERVINGGAVVPGDLLSFKVDRNVGGNEPNA